MSYFRIDLTNTATSALLVMLIDPNAMRAALTPRESFSLVPVYEELKAEIDRRFPIPGVRKPRVHTDCFRMPNGTVPCACLDGCGACDSCGHWLGENDNDQ